MKVKGKEKMTPKERVVAQIEHKETDFIPYRLRFEDDGDKTIKHGALERVNSYYKVAPGEPGWIITLWGFQWLISAWIVSRIKPFLKIFMVPSSVWISDPCISRNQH